MQDPLMKRMKWQVVVGFMCKTGEMRGWTQVLVVKRVTWGVDAGSTDETSEMGDGRGIRS